MRANPLKMAAERSSLLLVGHDDSLDEDDLERQEEVWRPYMQSLNAARVSATPKRVRADN